MSTAAKIRVVLASTAVTAALVVTGANQASATMPSRANAAVQQIATNHPLADRAWANSVLAGQKSTTTVSAANASSVLRPDLLGYTIQNVNDAAVYLMDVDYSAGGNPIVGVRRGIPDTDTAGNLFGNNWPTEKVVDLANITPGPAVSSGAFLATPVEGGGAIYFMDQGRRRHVSSPAKMDQYHFQWNRVVKVPKVLLDWLPQGPDI